MQQATSSGVGKGSDQLLTTVKKVLTHFGITGWQRSDKSTDRNDRDSFEDSDKLAQENDADLDFMFSGSCQQLLENSCGDQSDSSSSDESYTAMPPGGVDKDLSTTMPVTIVDQVLRREKVKQMTKSMSLPLPHGSPDPFPELTSAPVTPTLCQVQTRVTKSSPSSPVVRRYSCRISPVGSLRQSQENLASPEPVETMVNFYSGEGSSKPVLINADMTALDICHKLVEKNHAMPDKNWAIIERISKFNLERTLEDHECVFDVHHSWSGDEKNRLYFRKDFRKYDFFKHPSQFFPAPMLDIKDLQTRAEKFALASRPDIQLNILLQNVFGSMETMPDVQGYLYMKEGKRSWKKHFFVLRASGLYYSTKGNSKDPRYLVTLSQFDDVNIYSTIDAKKSLGAPTNYCLCLKAPGSGSDSSKLKLLCAEDEAARLCWLTGMRLVKYGSQLRENLKMSIRYDNNLQSEEKDRLHDTLKKSEEFGISRVPMDFTGNGGRIVNDPNEALGVAIDEVHQWRKKAALRPAKSPLSGSPKALTNYVVSSENPIYSSVHGLASGIHMTQPWFHSGITREEAVSLITEHGLVDGVFLVRESYSLPDTFVLSLCHSHHVKHCQINKVESDGQLYYSLDGGRTKFLDLIQLVDFYQLNAAGLPTRLTYFITKLL